MKNKHLLLIGITIMMLVTACGNNEESTTDNSKVSISRFEKDSNTINQEDEAILISLSKQQEIKKEQEENDNNRYNSNEHVGELVIKNENNTGESLENNDNNANETEESTEPSESDTESNETSETKNDNNVENTDNVSEVDNTQDLQLAYEISNNDIIYNNVIYTDLYLSIQQIEQQSQYDTDTLIKFILQTYPSNEQVYTFVQMYGDNEITEGEDYNDMLIDETLSEASDNYNDICNKYNDRATWMLTINKWMGKDKAMLAGCKSFTIIIGTDEDIEVDITDFN